MQRVVYINNIITLKFYLNINNYLYMLKTLYVYSKSRKYWSYLIFSIILIISVNLFIQYFYFKPCVLCIYQRCALFGIGLAGIITLISPSSLLLRLTGILIYIYSAFKGLYFTKIHINMILNPEPVFTCNLFIKFPNWLPLNSWWPFLFNSSGGNCSIYKWYFLSMEISQWTLIIFIIYFVIAILTAICQFLYFR